MVRDPEDAIRAWRCRRDPTHAGRAIVPLIPRGPGAPRARTWVCPYCAAPVVLAPPGPPACERCGRRDDLRRAMSPSGAFEWYCAAHDPLPRHEVVP